MVNIKLKIKLFLKAIFHTIIPNKNLKNKILKFFGRDYELNKNELSKIENINLSNINAKKGDFIVSLTTFPKRIHTIKYTLYSIFMQNLQPKKVILSLSNKEFENEILPDEILEFQKYGLDILWNENNLYQYNKIIPVLQKYNNEVIITLDDDIFYPQGLLKGLFESHLKNKNVIWAQRARIVNISNDKINSFSTWNLVKKNDFKNQENPRFDLFLEGVGGVLYPPNSLYKDVVDDKKIMKLSPKADDLWLFAMAILNGTKIAVVKNNLMANGNAMTISPHSGHSLWLNNLISGNDKQLQSIINHYPNIIEILKSSKKEDV